MDNYTNFQYANADLFKILVVDDSPINRMMVGKLLKNWGMAYKEAASAEDAFEMISDKSYSLVLMDINMPGVSGLEACEFIRQLTHPYFKEIPIIGFSANRVEDLRTQLQIAGLTDYIAKPFTPEMLKSKITALQNCCDQNPVS